MDNSRERAGWKKKNASRRDCPQTWEFAGITGIAGYFGNIPSVYYITVSLSRLLLEDTGEENCFQRDVALGAQSRAFAPHHLTLITGGEPPAGYHLPWY